MRRVLSLAVLCALFMGPARAQEDLPPVLRFATFNAQMTEDAPGALLARLATGDDPEIRLVAETIQRVRPDVLLLQEIDRDADGRSLALFAENYLAVSQNGAAPIHYPHTLFPPSNTGVPTGLDLDGDGALRGPGDAKGFGRHPGQYGFALLSRVPLGTPRTYRDLLWRDFPGSLMPKRGYPDGAEAVLPLSSKTHLVVPVADGAFTLIAAHPVPPIPSPAARNERRNYDEIGLVLALLEPDAAGIPDDAGEVGGLPEDARAVVMGDFNADPERGDSWPGAIGRLLEHPRLATSHPVSSHGNATADFSLRVDYVLSTEAPLATGVVWFADDDPLARLNGASDHRMVWADLARDPAAAPAAGGDGDPIAAALAPPNP